MGEKRKNTISLQLNHDTKQIHRLHIHIAQKVSPQAMLYLHFTSMYCIYMYHLLICNVRSRCMNRDELVPLFQ